MRTRTRDRSRRVPLVAHPHVAQQADLPGLARASSPPATVLQLALRASFPPLPVRGRGRAGGRSRRAAWCKTGGSARAGAPQRSGCGRIGDGRRVREGSRAMRGCKLPSRWWPYGLHSRWSCPGGGLRAAGCGDHRRRASRPRGRRTAVAAAAIALAFAAVPLHRATSIERPLSPARRGAKPVEALALERATGCGSRAAGCGPIDGARGVREGTSRDDDGSPPRGAMTRLCVTVTIGRCASPPRGDPRDGEP